MKLEPDFFAQIMIILNGKITSSLQATSLASRLETHQELFAWLLLRQNLAEHDAELANQLIQIAKNNITKAESRRPQNEFPLEQQQAYARLEDALREKLNADRNAAAAGQQAQQALAEFRLSQSENLKKPSHKFAER